MKAKAVAPGLAVIYLGVQSGIQSSDPNINSTALLRAAKSLDMGNLAALAASISTLMLAATVVTTGMLADKLGRKKVITVAFLLAALGDILVMLAPNSGMFLVGRVIAGIGLGAVYGAAFAYVKHFATGKGGLPAAMGAFMAAGGAVAVMLTFVGGVLAGIDWRVAYILIPIASIISMVVGLIILPPDTAADRSKSAWDVPGQLLLGLGVIAFLYGVAHMSVGISTPLTWAPVAVGIILLIGFYFWERHHGDAAFFPVGLFRNPIFLGAIFVGLVYNLSYGAGLLSFTNLFQYTVGLTGSMLAVGQLPFLLAGIIAALVFGRLRGRGKLSRRGAVIIGTVVVTLGFVALAAPALGHSHSYWSYLVGIILIGGGAIIASLPYGSMILDSADPAHLGPVSSSRTTIGQFWFSIGLAGSTVLIDGFTRSDVQSQLGGQAAEQLNTWAVSGGRIPVPKRVLDVAGSVYPDAFGWGMIITGAVCLVGGVVAVVFMTRGEKVTPAPVAEVSHT